MKKRILTISGIVALALLLAGAAFVGGRLLNGQGQAQQSSGSDSGPSLSSGGKNIPLDFQPATEIPQTPADVQGLFDHRQDNTVFVGTGKAVVGVTKDGEVDSSHSGPSIEVIITTQTEIYEDVTQRQYNGQPSGEQKIQQVLEPGSLDNIGEGSFITIWGKKTGDRIIADVLVYSAPGISGKPPAGQ